MPDLYHLLSRLEWAAAVLRKMPVKGEVNLGQTFQLFYLKHNLGLVLDHTGWINGVGQMVAAVFGLVLGYAVGAIIDRVKPIRVIPLVFMLWAVIDVFGYGFVKNQTSAAIFSGLINIVIFMHGVALGAVTIELFPREKLGQFCSAQAIFYQVIITVINPLFVGPFFDHIQFNRFGYLWSGMFHALAGVVSIKIYCDWRRRQSGVRHLAAEA